SMFFRTCATRLEDRRPLAPGRREQPAHWLELQSKRPEPEEVEAPDPGAATSAHWWRADKCRPHISVHPRSPCEPAVRAPSSFLPGCIRESHPRGTCSC